MSVAARAAYLADLSEEWPAELTPPSIERNKHAQMDFGSIVVRDTSLSRTGSIEYGTTVLRSDDGVQNDAVPANPLATGPPEKNQLAWAAAAVKFKGDLLGDQTPKAPNRLQALFIVPDPPTVTNCNEVTQERKGEEENVSLQQEQKQTSTVLSAHDELEKLLDGTSRS